MFVFCFENLYFVLKMFHFVLKLLKFAERRADCGAGVVVAEGGLTQSVTSTVCKCNCNVWYCCAWFSLSCHAQKYQGRPSILPLIATCSKPLMFPGRLRERIHAFPSA